MPVGPLRKGPKRNDLQIYTGLANVLCISEWNGWFSQEGISNSGSMQKQPWVLLRESLEPISSLIDWSS
jgi:hypothetical protein